MNKKDILSTIGIVSVQSLIFYFIFGLQNAIIVFIVLFISTLWFKELIKIKPKRTKKRKTKEEFLNEETDVKEKTRLMIERRKRIKLIIFLHIIVVYIAFVLLLSIIFDSLYWMLVISLFLTSMYNLFALGLNEIISRFTKNTIFNDISDFIINDEDGKKYLHEFNDDYEKLFKNKTIEDILKREFSDIKIHKNEFNFNKIKSLGIVQGDNYYESDDYISGKYKDISFELTDAYIYAYVSKFFSVAGSYETIFKGQWYIFDFNKKFKADIKIYGENNKYIKSKSSDKVDLEDIEFNNMFDVYSDNKEEVFYVLTPNIIEKIKELNNNVDGKIYMLFDSNKLHIAINNNKNLFDFNNNDKLNINDFTEEEANNEIDNIKHFVKTLDLDNDLFIIDDK